MVNFWRDVKLGPKALHVVDAVIETPKLSLINMSTTKKMRFSD